MHKILGFAMITASASILGGCGPQKAVVAAPPPPPPAVVYAPRAPTPPFGASAGMVMPAVGPDGLRMTPNRNLGPLETIWHVRAGFNVSALNCQRNVYKPIADHYNRFLKNHKSTLRNANRAIEGKFRRENKGKNYRRIRDTHSTQVYNFFSFPPLTRQFCDKMLVLGQEGANVPSKDLKAFAARALPEMEKIFVDFYAAYEEYEADLAAWRAKYGRGS